MHHPFKVVAVLMWFSLALLGGITPAEGQFEPIYVLNPKTYRSPSGGYALTVDPSDRYGRGEAKYRCEEKGQEQWSGTLPFTLWEAAITEDGTVGGYAYSHGKNGWGGDSGDFHVVILDRNGKLQLKESKKREVSRFIHGPTDPQARGLIVDQVNDRMVVRVGDPDLNRGHESWWVYRLSTATAVGTYLPATLMDDNEWSTTILDARTVAGTPLTLVHWWRYDERKKQVGARFTLVDLKATPVWNLVLPDDYTVRGSERSEDRIQDLIERHGAILQCHEPGRFELFFVAKSKRVKFTAENLSGKWKVTEVSRSPHQFPTKPKPRKLEEIVLDDLAPVQLESTSKRQESPIRNVNHVTFDDRGQIAFLRQDDDEPPVFVQIDQTGKLVCEIPLTVKVKADSRWTGCSWVGGTRFVVANSDAGLKAKAHAWWVDTKTRQATAISGFECPAIDRLVGFADGGFVALVTRRFQYTMESALIAFDKQGKRLWELTDDYNRKGQNPLFGVKDIARTSREEIVVLENIDNKAKIDGQPNSILRCTPSQLFRAEFSYRTWRGSHP